MEAVLGRSRRCIGIVLMAGLLSSVCMFRTLGRDLARIDEMALVGGHTTRAATDSAPIVVVLYTSTPPTVVDSFVLEKPGAYFFTAPPGTYRIAAFVDRNRDFVYEPEPSRRPSTAIRPTSWSRAARQAAEKIHGFDASHAGILSDAEGSATLNGILAEAVR